MKHVCCVVMVATTMAAAHKFERILTTDGMVLVFCACFTFLGRGVVVNENHKGSRKEDML